VANASQDAPELAGKPKYSLQNRMQSSTLPGGALEQNPLTPLQSGERPGLQTKSRKAFLTKGKQPGLPLTTGVHASSTINAATPKAMWMRAIVFLAVLCVNCLVGWVGAEGVGGLIIEYKVCLI